MILNKSAIDQTIQKMCAEVKNLNDERTDWKVLSEEALFYEIAVCIFGSQMLYEHALAMADVVKKHGMLRKSAFESDFKKYAENLKAIFSKPLEITKDGMTRKIIPRFKNRLPKLLSETAQNIYGNELTIKRILNLANDSLHARELLVRNINGFGPKQASLFLRRVGYCTELAILDTHILDYLKIAAGIELKPSAIARLKWYENVEVQFKRISEDFGYSVGCVDLAMWITMRVAKREYAI
jgi:N-glycosylase/DNA lyase